MASIEEETKELSQDGNTAAEHIEHGAAGAISALEKTSDGLEPGNRVPPDRPQSRYLPRLECVNERDGARS